MFYAIAALLALAAPTEAAYAVDLATPVTVSTYQCLAGKGFTRAIPRVFRSTGSVDKNAPSNIKNAWAAGYSQVDGYLFPCPKCGTTGAAQVKAAVDYLNTNGLVMANEADVESEEENVEENGSKIGWLWLDVEMQDPYWSTSTSTNIAFIQSMVDQCKSMGIKCGIYSSWSQWNPITGGTTKFSTLPLWYAHYDNVKNFSDFKAFGGWKTPTMKQYAGDVTYCSTDIDKNYF